MTLAELASVLEPIARRVLRLASPHGLSLSFSNTQAGPGINEKHKEFEAWTPKKAHPTFPTRHGSCTAEDKTLSQAQEVEYAGIELHTGKRPRRVRPHRSQFGGVGVRMPKSVSSTCCGKED
ncbi:hypothetical protein E2562_033281 [Oryza meyeriana var. granulata]|uniref:Uncharacterized protein n=1 Tax=Oryza meyeriana var. granulata TaxID=110450 RepID=A0A6G1CXR5_9ORYZ|nr:hypothetical protein E2562_033281 [Oryza meyeriana var. granulata]